MIRRATRRRWRWLSIVAVANLVAVGLVAAPSQARGVSLCSGTAENFTIAGDLAVPAGASCRLVNSTVTGEVEVRADANLELDGATVGGDLTVWRGGFVAATGSSVAGVTTLRRAFGASAEDSELTGGVDARRAGFFFSDRTTHGGDVRSGHGQTVILSGWVAGDVRTNRDLLTDLTDSVVTGGVRINRAQFGSVICRSEIDGDTVVRNSGDLVQFGSGGPVVDCAFNVFGARLVLRDNSADSWLGGNVLRGDLRCDGNQTAPAGEGNRIRGQARGQCAELAPAAAAPAGPALRGSAGIEADSRFADIEARIEDRSAAAAAAVAAEGPASL